METCSATDAELTVGGGVDMGTDPDGRLLGDVVGQTTPQFSGADAVPPNWHGALVAPAETPPVVARPAIPQQTDLDCSLGNPPVYLNPGDTLALPPGVYSDVMAYGGTLKLSETASPSRPTPPCRGRSTPIPCISTLP